MFDDRTAAGRQLGQDLVGRLPPPIIVLALPRGGVPVGAEVAAALDAPLDVIGVRKVGAPGQPELGVGAVAEDGGIVLDEEALAQLHLTERDLEATIAAERREVIRRVERYRDGRPLPDLENMTVVVVDDGMATGVTAKAALRAVRSHGAGRVVLAVPVCSSAARISLRAEADEVLCLVAPEDFIAVGRWYRDFAQTSDDQVLQLLARTNHSDGRH